MKVDLSKELEGLDGKPLVNESNVSMTVADVLKVVLTMTLEGDEKDSGEQRIRKFNIVDSIYKSKNDSVDIEAKDVELLKERVLKIYPSPIIYKRICEAFGEKS